MGACRETKTAQGEVEYCIFRTHKHRRCFKCIVLPGHLAWSNFLYSTQTTAIFGDQDISKCLYNLFLVIE